MKVLARLNAPTPQNVLANHRFAMDTKIVHMVEMKESYVQKSCAKIREGLNVRAPKNVFTNQTSAMV